MSTAERARAAAPATEEEILEAAPAANDGLSLDDEAAHKAKFNRMREVFAKQEKVKIRLPKGDISRGEDQLVTINGYSFLIQRGVQVEVPIGVAEVLEQAGLI